MIKHIDLMMFFLWVWGIVCGWVCSNWFADLRCEKAWDKWNTPKYEKGLLSLIWWYNRSNENVTMAGKRIIEIICDAVRDIIPDIEGWVGTEDGSNLLFFNSKLQSDIWWNKVESNEGEQWECLDFLIEKVFPELKYCVDDNCIYLPPEKQNMVIERLEKLRGEK